MSWLAFGIFLPKFFKFKSNMSCEDNQAPSLWGFQNISAFTGQSVLNCGSVCFDDRWCHCSQTVNHLVPRIVCTLHDKYTNSLTVSLNRFQCLIKELEQQEMSKHIFLLLTFFSVLYAVTLSSNRIVHNYDEVKESGYVTFRTRWNMKLYCDNSLTLLENQHCFVFCLNPSTNHWHQCEMHNHFTHETDNYHYDFLCLKLLILWSYYLLSLA